jgi:hypothetical protein
MDAGGDGYKKLKESVEKLNRDVAELNKTITRNNTVTD